MSNTATKYATRIADEMNARGKLRQNIIDIATTIIQAAESNAIAAFKKENAEPRAQLATNTKRERIGVCCAECNRPILDTGFCLTGHWCCDDAVETDAAPSDAKGE